MHMPDGKQQMEQHQPEDTDRHASHALPSATVQEQDVEICRKAHHAAYIQCKSSCTASPVWGAALQRCMWHACCKMYSDVKRCAAIHHRAWAQSRMSEREADSSRASPVCDNTKATTEARNGAQTCCSAWARHLTPRPQTESTNVRGASPVRGAA